jgi:hypothetical protein
MLKKVLNLNGVQELSKIEQKSIKGSWGQRVCCEYDYNPDGVIVCTLWISQGQYCP